MDFLNADFFNQNIINLDNQKILLGESLLFLFFTIAVCYLLIFAISSLKRPREPYPEARKSYRFAILVPAYQADETILETINSLLLQDYPPASFDIIVISDMMSQETESILNQLSVSVIHPEYTHASKTAALRYAIRHIESKKERYDIVLLMDANNLVNPDYLQKINNAFYSGCYALQTHRVAQSLDTRISVLDAVSEEMNNSIFRKGHTNFGFSSALIGSGMAFDYQLFRDFIHRGDDRPLNKELERYLLLDNIYIDYLENVYVYDEKVKKRSGFYEQRRRWLSNQILNLSLGIIDLPLALLRGKWDYCNKLFQWLLPPRIILLGLISVIAVGLTGINWILAIKWWILLFVLLLTFSIAIPSYLVNNKLTRALSGIPVIFVLMLFNHFRIIGGNKQYIHTKTQHNG